VLLTGRFLPGGAGPQAIEISSPQFTDALIATTEGTAFRRNAFLPGGRRLQIRFSCRGLPATAAGSCFQLVDFQVVDLGPVPEVTAPVENVPDDGE
jgi:hypothetical protein